MSSDAFFDHLFEYAQQVTPYLAGVIAPIPEDAPQQDIIHVDHPCSENIQDLYERLKAAHPEAGSAYWLARTWDLICWQPVYLSFISIYALHGLPDLTRIGQKVQSEFVAGFQFESTEHVHGTEVELVAKAGIQLQTLFAFFREEMSQWTRIRPGFTNHLFADGVLGCLVKLSKFAPDIPNDYLLEQASLWLDACGLPAKLVKALTVDEQSGELKLVRTSCCLVYKCHGRKLCEDCPRHPDNKA
ncbi:siderophore ferric iron reductase [Vibrio sp. Isolate24]|uniref:siderophore ferric iron reductase n=1 Tax=Vibrio sp. Isolate24 TaxID=2908534 RepID=UPI001EFD21C8|nr:siderophore ferric iron reductase [Vibrio sp. Isolate24]MCG9676720.1 siderophore ferric iron reductase [Vibrio sp. Isolate24]